jgi:hypothetical protein
MKLTNIVLFISTVFILAAANPSHLKGKIKTIHMDKWPDMLVYHYDNKGRVSSMTTGKDFETIYEYKGNTITARTKKGSTVTMYLNSRGLVDSLTDVDSNRKMTSTPREGFPDNEMFSLGISRYFPYSGNHILAISDIAGVTTHDIIRFSKKIIYDDAGFIKEERVYLSSGRQIVAVSEVKDGNTPSYTVRYPIDTLYRINPKTLRVDTSIVRQDDLIVKNTFDLNRTNSLASQSIFGKSNKNLIMRSVNYDQVSKDSIVTTFKYSFGKGGKVTSLATAVKTNDPPEEKVYIERPDTCLFTYY